MADVSKGKTALINHAKKILGFSIRQFPQLLPLLLDLPLVIGILLQALHSSEKEREALRKSGSDYLKSMTKPAQQEGPEYVVRIAYPVDKAIASRLREAGFRQAARADGIAEYRGCTHDADIKAHIEKAGGAMLLLPPINLPSADTPAVAAPAQKTADDKASPVAAVNHEEVEDGGDCREGSGRGG